jgi:hypothetical protein
MWPFSLRNPSERRCLCDPMKSLITSVLILLSPGWVVGGVSVNEGSPAETLARLVRDADSVKIRYLMKFTEDEVEFSDPEWTGRLADRLGSSSYRRRSPCLCISFPELRFVKEGKVVLVLSVHHGNALRASFDGPSGDFLIGEATGGAVGSAMAEKRPANVSLTQPRPRIDPPAGLEGIQP